MWSSALYGISVSDGEIVVVALSSLGTWGQGYVFLGSAQDTFEARDGDEEIIATKEQIRKFFFEKHFDFLTSVPQRRLQEMILSSCTKGNSGKMTDEPFHWELGSVLSAKEGGSKERFLTIQSPWIMAASSRTERA